MLIYFAKSKNVNGPEFARRAIRDLKQGPLAHAVTKATAVVAERKKAKEQVKKESLICPFILINLRSRAHKPNKASGHARAPS